MRFFSSAFTRSVSFTAGRSAASFGRSASWAWAVMPSMAAMPKAARKADVFMESPAEKDLLALSHCTAHERRLGPGLGVDQPKPQVAEGARAALAAAEELVEPVGDEVHRGHILAALARVAAQHAQVAGALHRGARAEDR